MGCVAPELLDQTVFPIEIGLHRAGIDVGAFIGTPVIAAITVGRQGFGAAIYVGSVSWASRPDWTKPTSAPRQPSR